MIYCHRVAVALSQLLSTLAGGYPDETLSAYSYRLKNSGSKFGWAMRIIDYFVFWEKDHCKMAREVSANRYKVIPELRDTSMYKLK